MSILLIMLLAGLLKNQSSAMRHYDQGRTALPGFMSKIHQDEYGDEVVAFEKQYSEEDGRMELGESRTGSSSLKGLKVHWIVLGVLAVVALPAAIFIAYRWSTTSSGQATGLADGGISAVRDLEDMDEEGAPAIEPDERPNKRKRPSEGSVSLVKVCSVEIPVEPEPIRAKQVSRLDQLEREIDQLKEALELGRKEEACLLRRIQKAESLVKEKKREGRDPPELKEHRRLQVKLIKEAVRRNATNESIKAREKELAGLNRNIDAIKVAIHKNAGSISSLQANLASFEKDLGPSRRAIDYLKTDLAKAEQTIEGINGRLASILAALKGASRERKELEDDHMALIKQHRQLITNMMSVARRLQEQERKFNDMFAVDTHHDA